MGIIKHKQMAKKSSKHRSKNGVFANFTQKYGRKLGATLAVIAMATFAVFGIWNITKAAPVVYNFGYTGTPQIFTAPEDGEYTFEAWGASGGYGHENNSTRAGGKGAYTSGKTYLSKGDSIYVYVGGVGANAKSCGIYCGGAGGWNGGAKGGNDANHDSQPDAAGGGGGATDFRLGTSLHSRIMVAGGGAGGSYGRLGRAGNGLSGDGSSQVGGHSFGVGQAGITHNSGSGGGGGGYWGGISNQVDAGQGYGGSSFVSGHPGAVAISSASSTTPRLASNGETVCTPALAATDVACSEHYSGSLFFDSTVLAGSQTFLSPAGASAVGHTGNGYARITGEFYTDETDQPVINSVSPNTSATSGGQQITIYGDNFEYIGTPTNDGTEKIAKVLIGGAECINVVFNGDSITCTTSANASGSADIFIYNGKRSTTKSGLFEYDTPTVGSITPSSGPTAGGQEITIPVTGISASTFPSTYTPIEYINFTGTQYINTGVNQLNNPKVVVDFQQDPASAQQTSASLIGTRSSQSPDVGRFALYVGSGTADRFRMIYNASGTNTVAETALLNPSNTNRYIAEASYSGTTGTAGIDGDSKSFEQTIPTIGSNFFIGNHSTANAVTANTYYKGKIFGAQIYKNNLLVRNFQPAKRNSDNVLGLFDKVTGAFYPNNGTGVFGAGPALPSNTHFSNVTVGGKVCTNATYENDKITCTTSPHVRGVVDVVIDNGLDKATIKDGYEYTMSASTVSPNVGSIEGGQEVTITGENLQTPTVGYTVVDYLNFTGTQYINSGVTQVNNPKITVDFQPNATGQKQYANIFGVYGSSTSPYASGSGLRINNGTVLQYNYNRLEDNVHTGVIVGSNSGARSSFEMIQNGQAIELSLDGTKYSASQRIPTIARPYFIGLPNNGGTANVNQSYQGKIYSMQMYENGSIVRDFQPARRNSDNVLGMYDKINGVFYGNNGTGTFGAGAVKPDAYLGTIKLGNSVCIDPTTVSDGVITCTSRSSESGVFDVTVDNTVDTVTLPDSYEYLVDNYLKTLTSSEGEISPSFDPYTLDYTLTLPVDKPCLTIEATSNDTSATITGTGDHCKKDGETIVVTVTATNGETRDYTLTVSRPASDNDTLADLQIDGATINGYNPATKTYQVEINDHTIREVEISYEKSNYYQTTTPDSNYKVAIEPGATTTDITVTSEDGLNTSTYTVIVSQPHTSRLMSLSLDGGLVSGFDPDTLTYSATILSGSISTQIDAVPFDSEATVTVTGAAYIPSTGGVVTIKVTRAGVEDSIYTINISKQSEDDIQQVYNYPYKGTVQMFVAPVTSEYLLEAWGSSGGRGLRNMAARTGGNGAYTSGKIFLNQGDVIYIYTGGVGGNANRCIAGVGGWNGGATGGRDTNCDAQPDAAGGGGGATDFRLDTSYSSRIMVAGGGAGGSYGFLGLPANALTGSGSTQVSGHSFGAGQAGHANTSGSGGGGGGYWGGTSNQVASGQGYGGSSYVSGYPGAVAILSASDTTSRLASDDSTVCTPALAVDDEKCAEHYSGRVFTEGVIKSGSETFLSPTGANETGHVGSGYGRITMIIPPSNDNTLSELSFSNGTLSPVFNPADAEGTPYSLSVPSNQPIVTTTAITNHRLATVIGHGEETILPADIPIEILVSVTSESGLVRDYITTATRPADANSRINLLTMGSIPSGLCRNNGEYADYSCRFNDSSNNTVFFDPNVTDYYINVPTVSNRLDFTATKGHLFQEISASVGGEPCAVDYTNPTETATISCGGLPMGDSEIAITATAETGAQTTYTLHIFRTPGADIQDIEVVDTPDEPADLLHFNPLATDYGVTGQPDTEAVNFEVTVDSEVDIQVKFTESGEYEPCAIGVNGKPVCAVSGLDLKKNDIWIQATLNGMVKTYYINWYRQLNSNTFLEYLRVYDAQNITEELDLSPSFDKTNDTYMVYVPFTTTEVLIEAEAERPDVSTILGDTGVHSVAVSNNRFVIRVQAQDASESEYIVNVVRRADPNATVANIESTTPFTPAFDPETLNYIMDLDPHFTEIDFTTVEMQSSDATYQVIGNSNLTPGVSEVIVRGVAADGTTKDYIFTVNIEPSSNNALANLQAICGAYDGETLSSAVNCQLVPDFDVDEASYSMTVPGEVATVTLNGTLADDLSTVTGLDEFALVTGTNEFDITVTAQDGSERVITVTVERQQDNNNLLRTWELKDANGEELDFGFDPATNNYTLTVENEVSRLAVTALPLRSASQVVLGANSPWQLVVGQNEFDITVVAENGETNIYTIEITRKPSSDVCLTRLTLQEARISPDFDCDITEYTAEVPYWITEVSALYQTSEPNATVAVTNNNNLEVGDNTVTVTVTAEDGTTTKDYQLTVHRREDTAFSSRLVNLWTNTGTWDDDFAPEKLYYEVDVDSTVSQVQVGGIVEDIDGPATVEGLGNHTLTTGNNIIQVVVTATDNSTTTYTLNIKRAPSTDANLRSLVPRRGTLSPSFRSDVLIYTMTADEGFVDLVALPRHEGATVTGANNSNVVHYPLDVGENTIDVEVTAEDGVTKKIYTIVVTRLVGVNAQLSQLRVGDNMALTPSFRESTGAYTVANVPATTETLEIYAKTRDTTATVRIGDEEYELGESTRDIPLEYGRNYLTIDVLAANGVNTMQYVVTVTRNLSGNNNLASLTPSVGSLSPSFSAGITSYTMNVDYMTKQLNLDAVVAHDRARISHMAGTNYSAAQNRKSVTRTINLPNETTNITIGVTAQNGAVKYYSLLIRRNQNYPSTLDNLRVAPYDLTESFNSTKLGYTVEVDYEIDNVSKLPLNPIKSDPNATVVIGGGALNVGPNTVPITITSRDGSSTTTYTLNVIRRSYSNNFLTYISTNQSAEILPEFDKYQLSYNMTVPNTVSSINLSAEPENYNSSVMVGGTSFTGQGAAYTWPVALQYGENVIDITVTTSTNVKRVYKFTVTRKLATNTDLTNVSFRAGTQALEPCDANATFDPESMSCAFTPAFSNDEDSYTVQVPAGTARGEIIVAPASPLATVIGGGEVELVAGHNEFVVTVQAQDGTERQITVDFVREALDANRLTELQVVPGAEAGTSLEPTFTYSYDATEEAPYIVRVPGRVSMLGFDVQLEDSLYSTVEGVELVPVPDGESTRRIVVTAENGDQRTYNILLIKTPLDTNNFLDDLAVDGTTVPGFDPTEKFYYDLGTVPNSKTSVDISALVTAPAQVISGAGTINLESGDNNLQVQVQAENDDIRTYTVHIYRTPNDDNTLVNIVIPNHTLTNPFQQYNTTYYVVTSSKTTHGSLDIQPILSDPDKASYEIQYGQPEFEVGSNMVRIVVTAENGEQMTYHIYVVLQNVDENYHLEYLNTDIYELMEPTDPETERFSPTKFEYNFSVPMSEDRICLTARAESIQATILGAQDLANSTSTEVCYDLEVGINHIPVMVTASNGVVQEYILNITREGTSGISRIVAVPEKRIPNKGNSNTWFLIEVVPAGQPYYKEDGNGTNVVWDNKADILAGRTFQTDDRGVWDAAENDGTLPVAVAGGEYDVYFTGYSHLSKKKSGVQFIDGTPIEIEFTYDEDTLADMMAANTLDPSDPMYPLRAGDAGVVFDSDLSCGPVISDCVNGGMFSGDEWGDDLVNSLDTSAILTKLYENQANTQKGLTSISKEDLDGNGQINSLDLSITLNNLFQRGDK